MSRTGAGRAAERGDLNESLRQAARVNDFERIKDLVAKGADVNSFVNSFTPLRWASMYGHKEAVAILLEKEARDDLHSAAARGDVEAMEELLASGNGDAHAVNRGGETALMWAAYHGRAEAIKLLVKAKANVNARDQHGFTALMEASQGGHVESMNFLIASRADVNLREPEDDETAAIMADHCARHEAVQVLIDAGAEPPPARVGAPATAPR